MFKKVLIANRGEIACRIIRTFRRMEIKALAVYSEADEGALHVQMADEAFFLGPAPAQESYLKGVAIIKIAKEMGAEAIHPGYGFLSENSAFAEAVQQAGLVFIGPPPKAIAAMGDKLEAKKLAHLASVPCLPGTDTPLADPQKAQKIAVEIGYPLMVKAAAGGGGKGMRIVKNSDALLGAVKSAMNEAESSFGDSRIFLEKYIESARHIEIQILADTFGNAIHLGERECSLQRRHQKVIEEAPSPFITPMLREEMTEAALRLVKEVQYYSAGTVEFVVSPDKTFYFLEMNTRLQVEHPTTEMVTGLDLVEEMVRIAAKEPLRYQQKDIQFKGHAIEARIYAEDSTKGFLPSIGYLFSYREPSIDGEEVRVDSGVREGDVISPYYDPMIGKLCVHQSDRERASSKLLSALNEFYIRGVSTNISFISSLVHTSFFKKADFNTATLDELYENGFTPEMSSDPQIPLGVAAVMSLIQHHLNKAEFTVLINQQPHSVKISVEKDTYLIDKLHIKTDWKPGKVLFNGIFNGEKITLQIDKKSPFTQLSWDGYTAKILVVSSQIVDLIPYMPLPHSSETLRLIKAPMPGLIIDIFVKPGDVIKTGQPLAAVEAMKMENVLQSACDGIIEMVYIKKGERVNLDQPLIKIE
ncbi:MAG: acetyl-CoA carboxylase biotin carboxylase subunit [Alphaproteobacteria bacterium]|nr:acetyl-CoA carboxylase biotin carboxylase subunit [Alphaproteobacteria bacterium]